MCAADRCRRRNSNGTTGTWRTRRCTGDMCASRREETQSVSRNDLHDRTITRKLTDTPQECYIYRKNRWSVRCRKKRFFHVLLLLSHFYVFFHVLYFPQLFKNRNVTVHRLQDPFSHTPPLNLHIYIILSLVNLITAFVFQICNPHSSTFLFLSEGQQLLFPSRITLSLESASQRTSPAY